MIEKVGLHDSHYVLEPFEQTVTTKQMKFIFLKTNYLGDRTEICPGVYRIFKKPIILTGDPGVR